MLEVKGLVKIYGRRRVVDGVDFHVGHGEIVGLLGPNGAGKTTSFRMACGMIEPNAGEVILAGVNVTHWPMYRRAKEGGMGYLAQESSVFRKLSVQNNLLGVMEMLGMDRATRRRRCEELLEQFRIGHLRKSLAMSLSGGERRRLEIARSLVSDPKLILLDEPFTGIDPVTIDSIQEIIRNLRTAGISILITDHQVRETLQITDRSYVIRSGRVLCQGSPQEVLANPEAKKYYFGDSMDIGPSLGGSLPPPAPAAATLVPPATPAPIAAVASAPRTPVLPPAVAPLPVAPSLGAPSTGAPSTAPPAATVTPVPVVAERSIPTSSVPAPHITPSAAASPYAGLSAAALSIVATGLATNAPVNTALGGPAPVTAAAATAPVVVERSILASSIPAPHIGPSAAASPYAGLSAAGPSLVNTALVNTALVNTALGGPAPDAAAWIEAARTEAARNEAARREAGRIDAA